MPVILPIAKFVLKWVAPSIPDIVSKLTTIKQQQGMPRTGGKTFEAHRADSDRQFAQHLQLIETLTRQIESFETTLRWALIIGIIALLLSLIGLAIMFGT